MRTKLALLLLAAHASPLLAHADFDLALTKASCAQQSIPTPEGGVYPVSFCLGTIDQQRGIEIKTNQGYLFTAIITGEQVISTVTHSHSGTPPILIQTVESTLSFEVPSSSTYFAGEKFTLDQVVETSNGQSKTRITGRGPQAVDIDVSDFAASAE